MNKYQQPANQIESALTEITPEFFDSARWQAKGDWRKAWADEFSKILDKTKFFFGKKKNSPEAGIEIWAKGGQFGQPEEGFRIGHIDINGEDWSHPPKLTVTLGRPYWSGEAEKTREEAKFGKVNVQDFSFDDLSKSAEPFVSLLQKRMTEEWEFQQKWKDSSSASK